jgi:hypothetical protein
MPALVPLCRMAVQPVATRLRRTLGAYGEVRSLAFSYLDRYALRSTDCCRAISVRNRKISRSVWRCASSTVRIEGGLASLIVRPATEPDEVSSGHFVRSR